MRRKPLLHHLSLVDGLVELLWLEVAIAAVVLTVAYEVGAREQGLISVH